MTFTRGQIQEIQAGVRPLAAMRTITFDGGIESGAISGKASLSTALTGNDNDIDYLADTAGTAGNSITIEYATGNKQVGSAIDVEVSGSAIKVNLATTATAEKATGLMTSDATNPDDNGTFVIGAKTYTFQSALTEAFATAVLTSDNTEVVDGDTVTVNDRVYRFKDTLALANDVKRSGTVDTTLANLRAAINGTGTPGTEYFAGTQAATGVTAGAVTAHAITVTANTVGVAANSFAKAETSIHLDWDGAGATFTGGVDSIANEVFIGASAAATLDNVKSAVNATAGAGTTYSSATTANATVEATTNTNTTQLFEALTAGSAGNSIIFTESATHISFSGQGSGGGTLEQGTDAGGITSTAADVITAIEASTPAAALVDVSLKSGNDGTGLVTTMAATNLASGSDGKIPLFTVSGECLVSLRGYISTDLTGTNATLVHGKTGTTNDLITILTATALDKGAGIDSTGSVARGTALAKTPLKLYHDGETIFATTATAAVTGGVIHYLADFVPLTEDAFVELS